jgi:hypothetical protein
VAEEFGIVPFGDGMILEEEGNNVGVNNQATHAAGSDLLDVSWPQEHIFVAVSIWTKTALLAPVPS